ncbi:hypothetical protein PR202_ga23964 [Eleusine coracana subsp. coracana]|uniref:Major facilitator superfamily (MFS) profile domain-containing protein n=1 Tax=Eleusine coracana subsp. coracana TaxID=191504 RepID=A0AAV5D7K6_ELECO|nr:hypothetical protein PR202_ga23964 [Eleusine coracana subsp. coracana]
MRTTDLAMPEPPLPKALPIQSLFPFLYFMIRDLHIAKDEEDIGFYAGFVGASYMLGRALSSILWGIVADKVILNSLFGLSSSYWMALTTRGLLGFLCGMLGPIKAYATEVCRKEHNHMALAIVSSSRGIGLIVGPAIGGYLAQPVDKYPGIFSEKSIFGRFPYFLPCLSISLLAVTALISCFWLPETLHKHTKDTILDDSVETVEESLAGTDAQESGGGCLQLFTNWPLMSAITVYCIFSLQDVAYAEVKIATCLLTSLSTFSWIFILACTFPPLVSFLPFVFVVAILNQERFAGLLLLLYQILIYPSVAKAVDPITLVRVIAIMTIPLLSSYAFMPALSGFILQLVVNCASFLKNSFSVTTITVFNILMNEAVTQDVRASANGVAVTLMSIAKTIAPAAAGAIFSWAQRRQTAWFLPGDHLVFFMMNVFTVIGLVFTFRPFYVRSNTKH